MVGVSANTMGKAERRGAASLLASAVRRGSKLRASLTADVLKWPRRQAHFDCGDVSLMRAPVPLARRRSDQLQPSDHSPATGAINSSRQAVSSDRGDQPQPLNGALRVKDQHQTSTAGLSRGRRPLRQLRRIGPLWLRRA